MLSLKISRRPNVNKRIAVQWTGPSGFGACAAYFGESEENTNRVLKSRLFRGILPLGRRILVNVWWLTIGCAERNLQSLVFVRAEALGLVPWKESALEIGTSCMRE